MYSSISKLDRDIARSFLNAPSNTISYRPLRMNNEQYHTMVTTPFQTVNQKESIVNDVLSQPHPNAQLGCPTNSTINPMYYDVIIDTVTDYDIFYPVAKETTKYYNDSYNNDQISMANNDSIYPRYHVERLDEFAASIDFPHDYDSSSIWSNQYQYEHFNPMKTVRFNDDSKYISYSRDPIDQYYFYPEKNSQVNNEQSPIRYITTPFFWFRPVLNHNYAICIPATRPSLHAFITSSFDRLPIQYETNSTPNPIRF